jgi:hypothetical protein
MLAVLKETLAILPQLQLEILQAGQEFRLAPADAGLAQ